MLQISKAINILHYHFRILKIHELFSPLRHTAIQRDVGVVTGFTRSSAWAERDDVTDTKHYINCHIVRKLAATHESKLHSVNIIPPRQGRRPECILESAGVAKDLYLMVSDSWAD